MESNKKFLEFAESLKLVRKAEVEFDGKNQIDSIYTDLLPNDGIINKVNLPRTTILIGRKGTGKSTIFQKSQKDIDKNEKFLSIYVDVKSLYDNSSPAFPSEIDCLPDTDELVKYLIYSNFIREIILKTKEKLQVRIEKKYMYNILNIGNLALGPVFEKLNEIETSIDSVFKKLNSNLITSYKNSVSSTTTEKDELSLGVGVKDGVSAKVASTNDNTNSLKKDFDTTLITYLDIKKCFIENLIKIKEILKVKNIFIYLDDYSEIDKQAQILFMDWFIAPVNNLSEDFVKFKIATYPKRFYYGKLDNSKIDEISLDFFDAFYTFEKKTDIIDISRMEHLSLDYTKRLLENRFKLFFPNSQWEDFFEINSESIYEIMFNASMNMPRKMGYILSYCYEACLIHKTRIGVSALENAALRYYNDVIEKYFLVNEYVCKPFEDKISNEHQYELLELMIKRQVSNKQYLVKRSAKDTSHFYINSDLTYLLDNLELNGFVTTYNKVKGQNNTFSTLFSLDYGLCKKFQLAYGKPSLSKTNSHSLSPIINFNNLILDYFNSTQVIRCSEGHEFPYSQLSEFKRFKMNCPTCIEQMKFTPCEVSIKFKELKQRFIEQEEKENIKVAFPEFMLLNFLKISQTSLSDKRIASTLDISMDSVSVLIDKLVEKEMCEHDIDVSNTLNREYVRITSKGVRLVERIEKLVGNVRIQFSGKPISEEKATTKRISVKQKK
jgi:DNA-binding MarR family transcriptional regulator